MAKRTPFTAQQERLERLLSNVRAEVAGIKTMVDVDRGLITAQLIKIDDPVSPQIIRVSEGGTLEVGGSSSWEIVDRLTVPVSHTGDLIETVIHTVGIPANKMGPNGGVRIWSIWKTAVNGQAAQWWNRIYFGGINIAQDAHTLDRAIDSRPITVWNKNDASAQGHVQNNMLMKGHFGNSAIQSRAIDTTQDVDIEFKALCGHVAHVVTLHSALVEVNPRS